MNAYVCACMHTSIHEQNNVLYFSVGQMGEGATVSYWKSSKCLNEKRAEERTFLKMYLFLSG